MKLNKRTVDAARASRVERFYWDEEIRGFGLRVRPSGHKSYLIQYRINGRTKRLRLGPHGVLTPQEARSRAIRLLAEVRGGGDPSAERHARRSEATVHELAERYMLQHAVMKKRASSVEGDRGNLRLHVLPALGGLRVSEVSRGDVAELHHSLRRTPTQANRVLALCSKMFNLAERWGLRPDESNPCRHVDRFPEKRRQRFLSEAELERLGRALREAEGPESASAVAAIRLLVFTGCRKGEVLRLRWEDVDFDNGRLQLQDSKTGTRLVPLNAPARKVLAGLERTSRWILPGMDAGKPFNGLTRAWYRIRARAALPDVRLHDLRHSFASVAVSAGASLPLIGGLLGHSQPSTTQRYAHLSDDPLRQVSEGVGGRLAAAMAGSDPGKLSRLVSVRGSSRVTECVPEHR